MTSEEKLRTLVESYLESLERDEPLDRARLLAEHPDIADELEDQLDAVDQLYHAGDAVSSVSKGLSTRRLRCPYCRGPVSFESEVPERSVCSSCGRDFRVQSGGRGDGDEWVEIPERVGKFEIVEVAGRGAFGIVYRARDPELGRTVAIKIPRVGLFTSRQDEERFLREARSVAALKHVGIVSVHEVNDEEGLPFIVSEFVDGLTLAEVIAQKPLTFREQTELLSRVCDAVEHAHERGVIHRDLKPGNILVDADGLPHVTDFGLAQHDDSEVTVTREGEILGTPAYMSPEQARGDHDCVNAQTDVYSIGVILYEMVTGERPFRGQRSRVIHQVLNDEPPPPRGLNDRVPRDLDTICLKALEKDPDDRYSTAADLGADLRRFIRGEPILARPTTTPERLWRWAKRNPTTAVLTASVALLLVTVSIGATIAALLINEARKDATEKAAAETAAKLEATRALEESKTRTIRLNVDASARQMDQGKYGVALLYAAEALKLASGDPIDEHPHRVRFGSTLVRFPRLRGVWLDDPGVHRIEFSPEGSRFLTASLAGTAQLWDVATGQPVGAPLSHGGAVTSVAFSVDGSYLGTASSDAGVRVWDLSRDEPSLLWAREHRGRVYDLEFSIDGQHIASASADQTVRIWKVVDGVEAASPLAHPKRVIFVEFDEDGKRLLTTATDHKVRVWSWRDGEVLTEIPHSNSLHEVSFDSDDRYVITACQKPGDSGVWDATTGERVRPQFGHDLGVTCASFSSDGRLYLTGSWDGAVRVRRVDTGEDLFEPIALPSSCRLARFTPDGRRLIVSDSHGTVHVHDAYTGQQLVDPLIHALELRSLAIDPSGSLLLVVAGNGTVKLWDFARRQPFVRNARHSSNTTALAVGPRGRRAATGDVQGNLRIWDTSTGASLSPDLPHGREVYEIDFDSDGDRVLATGYSRFVGIWETETAELHRYFEVGSYALTARFSPDERLVAAGSNDGWLDLWDVETGESRLHVNHGGSVRVLAFTSDSEWLAVGGTSATVSIWNTRTGEARLEKQDQAAMVRSLAFSPDDRLLAVGTDKATWLRDAKTGRSVIEQPLFHKNRVQSVRFNHDGSLLLTASWDRTARIWDGRTGAPVSGRVTYTSGIIDGIFSPDEHFVAMSDRRGSVRLWDRSASQPVSPPAKHEMKIPGIGFAEAGAALVTPGLGGGGAVWSLEKEQRPVEDLILLAQLLSGWRLEKNGALTFLSTENLRHAWETLAPKYPAEFLGSENESAAWHRAEFEACEERGHADASLFHAERWARLAPSSWQAHAALGWAYLALGDLERAQDSYSRSIELDCPEVERWFEYALVLAQRRERAAYRDLCARMRQRFGERPSSMLAALTLRAHTLGPNAVDEFAPLEKVAGELVDLVPYHDQLSTYGALLVRAGKFDDALTQLHKARRSRPTRSDPRDAFFISMAHYRKGLRTAGQIWYNRALEAEEWTATQKAEGLKSRIRVQKLETQLLKREATELLGMPEDAKTVPAEVINKIDSILLRVIGKEP